MREVFAQEILILNINITFKQEGGNQSEIFFFLTNARKCDELGKRDVIQPEVRNEGEMKL